MAIDINQIGTLRQGGFGNSFDARVQGTRGNIASQYLTSAMEAGANLGGSAGAARRGMLMAQGATQGERAANDMIADQQRLDLEAQNLQLEAAREQSRRGEFGQTFNETRRQFDRSLGLDRSRLNQDQRQFDARLGESAQDRNYALMQNYLSQITAGGYGLPEFDQVLSAIAGGGSGSGMPPISRPINFPSSASESSASGSGVPSGLPPRPMPLPPAPDPNAPRPVSGGSAGGPNNPYNDTDNRPTTVGGIQRYLQSMFSR